MRRIGNKNDSLVGEWYKLILVIVLNIQLTEVNWMLSTDKPKFWDNFS